MERRGIGKQHDQAVYPDGNTTGRGHPYTQGGQEIGIYGIGFAAQPRALGLISGQPRRLFRRISQFREGVAQFQTGNIELEPLGIARISGTAG